MKNVQIVYFSGTGGTARIAGLMQSYLEKHRIEVDKVALEPNCASNPIKDRQPDLFILLFAVYALDAPKPVYNWVKSLPQSNGIPVAVGAVSGGGEVWLNSACRIGCIKRLQKKGYKVTYETMFVMPSNFFVATNEQLSRMLLQVLPSKAEKFAEDLVSGRQRRVKPKCTGRVLTALFKLEKLCTGFFGKSLQVKKQCNACGWCVNQCPMGNIEMKGSQPSFKWRCIICLRCIYGCPKKAIYTKLFSFIPLKEGYNLTELEKRISNETSVKDIPQRTIWKGVETYLSSGVDE